MHSVFSAFHPRGRKTSTTVCGVFTKVNKDDVSDDDDDDGDVGDGDGDNDMVMIRYTHDKIR